MYIPVSAIVSVAVLLVVLVLLALRGRARSRDLMAPPASAEPRFAPQAATLLSPELEAEIRQLVRQKRKLDAIKRVREETHIGLAEAKDLVERL